MNRPTVYLVDDDDFARSVVTEILRPIGYPMEDYASAEAFLAALHPGLSGCLVLDMQMPGMSGTELQAELHRRGVRLPIIFLSGFDDVPTTVIAIKGGAEDYLIKPVADDILIERVLAAMARDLELRTEETSREQAWIHLAKLTAREKEILRLALAGHTNKEIARLLDISHRTIETHRAHIFLKTGASSLLDLAQMVAISDFQFPQGGPDSADHQAEV